MTRIFLILSLSFTFSVNLRFATHCHLIETRDEEDAGGFSPCSVVTLVGAMSLMVFMRYYEVPSVAMEMCFHPESLSGISFLKLFVRRTYNMQAITFRDGLWWLHIQVNRLANNTKSWCFQCIKPQYPCSEKSNERQIIDM
jgi:hypothetical protein